MGRLIDLTGCRFGRLVVLKRGEDKKWLCICDCGNEKSTTGELLRTGRTKSCGCLRREANAERSVKWDNIKRKNYRLYNTWRAIISRCDNPTDKKYPDYGGRGISLCKEWYDFDRFVEWDKSNGYSEDLTIDRKNTNEGYSPENCRWETYSIQSHNTRLKKNNTSGVRGVNFNKRTGKWMVRLWVDGKRKSFGYFYDLEEAINARKEAEIKYLGFQIDENGIVE